MSVILERGDHCSAVPQTSHERLSFTGIPETERPPECYLITVAMQNSDLETLSHNFAALQPRTYLKCLNLWFLLYWAGLLLQQHIVIEVKLTCVMTNPSSCTLLVSEQSNTCWILLKTTRFRRIVRPALVNIQHAHSSKHFFCVSYLTLWRMHLRATWDWDTQGYNGMTFGASLKWTLEEVQLPKILTCQTIWMPVKDHLVSHLKAQKQYFPKLNQTPFPAGH